MHDKTIFQTTTLFQLFLAYWALGFENDYYFLTSFTEIKISAAKHRVSHPHWVALTL